jgi:DNA polymerase I-like protein with 3'-5' exonuclease and polymerase domains
MMKKVKLTILCIIISISVQAENDQLYKLLAQAVKYHESRGDSTAFNAKEKAVGCFQIRPCRVNAYNAVRGTHYKLKDFYDIQLSEEMFLFYAKGKTLDKAARDWNGSGPMTLTYWQNIKLILKKIIMNLNPQTPEAYQLMHDGVLALSRAEQQGIRIDLEKANAKKKHLTHKIKHLEQQFQLSKFFKEWQDSQRAKVNPNSSTQLAHFLYDVKGLNPFKNTPSGAGSTNEESLLHLNIPELNDYLLAKRLTKARDTYLEAFLREQVNGYIHPFFNLHFARTYRSSSDSPNFQNIPIRDHEIMELCRGVLYPRPGHQLLEIDFKGVEVSVSACYCKDKILIKYVSDPTKDMHGDMAEQIFIMDKIDKSIESHKILRQAAKNTFVFPQFYGDYYKNNAIGICNDWVKLPQSKWKSGQGIELPNGYLSDHLILKGIKSFDQFIEHLKEIEADFWGVRFKQYAEWKEKHYAEYLRKGYFYTKTGFTCSGVMSKNDVSNYPIQGSAFHCLLWSLIETDKIMQKDNWDTKIIGQIHDSLVLDVNPNELKMVTQTIHRITTNDLAKKWKWIIVPLNVDMELSEIDHPWSEKKGYKFVV